MGIVKKGLGVDVLTAANARLKSIFANGLKVYLDSSGGKDSIVLMSLVYELIQKGEIDPKQLEVVFIDEEVIYDEVVRVCMDWRKKFMLAGVKYTWYTIEHRNNNCFNALENNENFIPWDRYESDKWARQKPPFAVSDSPYLIPRTENYQDFLRRLQADGITIIGVRTGESLNRYNYIATVNKNGGMSGANVMYPIYDWKDSDIWKYIKDMNLDFPDVYLRMYEAGVPKRLLRVCNLFSIDTCRPLTKMFEVYPDLWEAVVRREPNANLVRLYWDSEMFHRNTATKRKLEKEMGEVDDTDYRAKLIEVVNHPHTYFRNPHALALCDEYRKTILRDSKIITPKQYKDLYNALMAGDTKGRSLRAIKNDIYAEYLKREGQYNNNLAR